jgi:hypothetical protein
LHVLETGKSIPNHKLFVRLGLNDIPSLHERTPSNPLTKALSTCF